MLNHSRLPQAIDRILDAAHWAPSGDNAQPWHFEVHDDNRFDVCVHIEAGNVYEYRNGEPTLISAGTLLENIAIAAPTYGKRARWEYLGLAGQIHRIKVELEDAAPAENPLFSQIERRSVDRRPYQMRPLAEEDRLALSRSVGPEFSVEWHESLAARRKIAALTRLATEIRLRIPETFDIHNRILDWKRAYSPDGIPSRALGVDSMTLKMMRWTLAKRARTEIANRLGSPFFAGMQMDFLPGIFSAAYFGLRLAHRADGQEGVSQMLRVGQAAQRFWLTATSLGLVLQPCTAALAFAYYGLVGEPFTASAPERRKAAELARRAGRDLSDLQTLVFLGRIGFPQKAKLESRSLRVPLAQLVQGDDPA